MGHTFADLLQKSGYSVSCINEVDLTNDKTEDKDLVISFGGDNTFLKTASQICNQNTSVLGVNSMPKYQSGKLTSF